MTIPVSVTSIGEDVFSACTSLASVTIPDGVTSIDYWAFYDCTSLASVYYTGTLSDWLGISFGNQVANPCCNGADLYINGEKLTEATIPDSVTSIGKYAFYGCTSLSSVTIPDSMTSISQWVFQGCRSLSSVTIPDSVTSIEKSAFYGCTSLASVTIPSSVTSIGEYAFYGCTSLASVTIGDGVTSIDYNAFYGCTSLASVYYTGTLSDWLGISFNNGTANPCCNGADLYINGEKLTEATIPDGVTKIGSYAFYGCTSTSVTIPSSVTSIGIDAFSGCTSLASVYYTGTLAQWVSIKFGMNFFATKCFRSNPCSEGANLYIQGELLTNAVIPEGVTKIGAAAFAGCTSLTSLTIPESVTEIDWYVVAACTSLTSITVANTENWYSYSDSAHTKDETAIDVTDPAQTAANAVSKPEVYLLRKTE